MLSVASALDARSTGVLVKSHCQLRRRSTQSRREHLPQVTEDYAHPRLRFDKYMCHVSEAALGASVVYCLVKFQGTT